MEKLQKILIKICHSQIDHNHQKKSMNIRYNLRYKNDEYKILRGQYLKATQDRIMNQLALPLTKSVYLKYAFSEDKNSLYDGTVRGR